MIRLVFLGLSYRKPFEFLGANYGAREGRAPCLAHVPRGEKQISWNRIPERRREDEDCAENRDQRHEENCQVSLRRKRS